MPSDDTWASPETTSSPDGPRMDVTILSPPEAPSTEVSRWTEAWSALTDGVVTWVPQTATWTGSVRIRWTFR